MEKVLCDFCGSSFTLQSFERHLEQAHKKDLAASSINICEKESVFLCFHCSNIFETEPILKEHMRTAHMDIETDKEEDDDDDASEEKEFETEKKGKSGKKFTCKLCREIFTSTLKFNMHSRLKHDIYRHAHVYKLKCPLCELTFQYNKQMDQHLIHEHKIQLEEENLTFSSMEEFKQWKTTIEKETNSLFFVRTSKNKDKSLWCHRTGIIGKKPKGENPTKKRVTLKTGRHCPARIMLKERPTGIHIYFQKVHLGHTQSAEFLNLTKEVKDMLVSKLKAGLNFNSILRLFRKSEPDPNSELTRLNYLTKKDLYNVVREYGIRNFPGLKMGDKSTRGPKRGKKKHEGFRNDEDSGNEEENIVELAGEGVQFGDKTTYLEEGDVVEEEVTEEHVFRLEEEDMSEVNGGDLLQENHENETVSAEAKRTNIIQNLRKIQGMVHKLSDDLLDEILLRTGELIGLCESYHEKSDEVKNVGIPSNVCVSSLEQTQEAVVVQQEPVPCKVMYQVDPNWCYAIQF